MEESILMPKSGISVESCIIGAWRKQVGDEVHIGDVLFEYETDKAAFECESTAEGTLLEIFYKTGDEVAVLEPVCTVGKPGTQCGASPRAKNLAERLGVNVQKAEPTGPHGRVIARDVDRLYRSTLEDEPHGPDVIVAAEEITEEPLSRIRRVIAGNMLASLQNTAQLTHHHSFDAGFILNFRKAYKNAANKEFNGISVGDMILYAVSRTLPAFPYMNAMLLENGILQTHRAVHLGIAVDTPRGLMVPTIRNADQKSLKQISREVKELAEAARLGKINPDLLLGATFTVSNLGPTDVELFTPILNPPQVGILGVCGVVHRVRGNANGMEVYPSIGLSLTYDHRAVDGAPASRFVQALARNLENFPALLNEV